MTDIEVIGEIARIILERPSGEAGNPSRRSHKFPTVVVSRIKIGKRPARIASGQGDEIQHERRAHRGADREAPTNAEQIPISARSAHGAVNFKNIATAAREGRPVAHLQLAGARSR